MTHDDDALPMVALQPLRHACHACGSCCFGWRVKLVDADEQRRVEVIGLRLGVERPVEDGALRFEGGRCVFLADDRRCRVHAAFGPAAKPTACNQFPIRVTHTEDALRIGVDPACTSTHRSWSDGPELELDELAPPLERVLGPAEAPAANAEQGLIALTLMPAMTVPRFVRVVIGAPLDDDSDTGLPADFLERLAMRLKAMHLERYLADPSVGPSVAERLASLAEHVASAAPSDLRVHPDLAGAWGPFVLDVIRRQLFLRLGDPELPPEGQALALAAGAIAIASFERDFDRFAQALSSWARAIRIRALRVALFPRPATARWVVDGR